VDERHRHRYEVNPKYVQDIEKSGMIFVGQSEDGDRMEIMELRNHKYYVGVQYHPEYLSRPTKPSAPFVGFVLASSNKLNSYLKQASLSNGSPIKRVKTDHLNSANNLNGSNNNNSTIFASNTEQTAVSS
jgi:hypothetical protein